MCTAAGPPSARPRQVSSLAIGTVEDTTEDAGTVKGLCWKLLYGNHRATLGPESWDELVDATGGPEDVKALRLSQDLPVEPFNRALDRIGEELGSGDEEAIEQVAVETVRRWATMYRTLVDHLESRPERMLELFCSEIHPWFVGEDQAAHLVERRPGEAVVELHDGFHPAFRRGLVRGFVEITGPSAEAETLDEHRVRVRWEPVDADRPPSWRVLLDATRATFLPATLAPLLVGTGIAVLDGGFDALRVGLALLAAGLLHLAANMFNDVLDHRSGVDEANLTPTPFSGGSRVIQRGLLGWRRMALAAGLLGLVGVAIGLGLAWVAGAEVLVLGLAGVGLGVAYSAKPLRLADRGLGEAAAFLAFGPLLSAGAYAVQTGEITAPSVAAGLPVGLSMAALLTVNELPDARWDARTGRRTLVVRMGERAPEGVAVLLLAPFAVLASLVAGGLIPTEALVGLASLPLAIHVARGVVRERHEASPLVPVQRRCLALHALTGLLLTVGLVGGAVL